MISTEQKFLYSAYGFQIASDIPHPGFVPKPGCAETADVVISFGDLSPLWSELVPSGDRGVAKDQFVMFQIPEIATYLITDGNRITVSPMEGATPVQIRLYLDGYCMSVILIQRGILPLHGSAVVIDGKAYAIIGRSGAGKSTLAKAFLDQGYSFLCDDIIPVTFLEEGGEIVVSPAFPEQKLWQESLEGFGMESRDFDVIYEKEETETSERKTKFAIPVSQFVRQTLPLGGIFELVKTNKQEEVGIHPLPKNEQLRAVTHHTFHRSLINELGKLEWHFQTTVQLVNRVKVCQAKRSVSSFTAQELVSSIVEQIAKESV